MRAGDRVGRGILFSIVTFACFSSADAAVKFLSSGYSVVLIYFVTTAFAALPIAALVCSATAPSSSSRGFPKPSWRVRA
jgi:hypothetical protein